MIIATCRINPKAILFFGFLFAIGIPSKKQPESLAIVIMIVGIQTTFIFHGYALLFSNESIMKTYLRLRRWFEGLFAIVFAAAGLKNLNFTIAVIRQQKRVLNRVGRIILCLKAN